MKIVNKNKVEIEEELDFTKIKNPFVKSILSIISYDELKEKFSFIGVSVSNGLEKILNNKKNIIYLLSTSSWELYLKLNKIQKADKDICLAALRRSPDVYFHLDKKYKFTLEFGKELILSLIRNGNNIIEINNFIDTYFKTKKKIYEILNLFLLSSLKNTQYIILDDLSKGLSLVKSKNRNLYDLLISSKIIIGNGNRLGLGTKFQKDFSKAILNSDEIIGKQLNELIIAKRDIFSDITGISISNMTDDELFLLDTIIKLCVVIHSHKTIKKDKKSNNKLDVNENIEDLEKKDEEIYPKQKLDFCLPNCTYFDTGYDSYNISVDGYKTVNLSKEELLRFTSTGLINFISFYNMLCSIGLNFFWDNHKSSFINILNNAIGFNYPDGQGVNEFKSLRVLNLIATSLGIIGKVGDKYIKDYSDLESAKKVFLGMKSTRNVNGKQYPLETGLSCTPVVELALKDRGYISEKGELSFTKFIYGIKEQDDIGIFEKEEIKENNIIIDDLQGKIFETINSNEDFIKQNITENYYDKNDKILP